VRPWRARRCLFFFLPNASSSLNSIPRRDAILVRTPPVHGPVNADSDGAASHLALAAAAGSGRWWRDLARHRRRALLARMNPIPFAADDEPGRLACRRPPSAQSTSPSAGRMRALRARRVRGAGKKSLAGSLRSNNAWFT
jgi:hypothetical protein